MADLKSFINEQRAKAGASNVDWTKRREKWLGAIGELFQDVEHWLIQAGVDEADIQLASRTIAEESIGEYKAPTLTARLSPQLTVTFTPVATLIIGGYGRVDVTMQGGHKGVLLVAVDADEEHRSGVETPSYERTWTWKAFPTRSPNRSFAFDEKGLVRLLTELVG